MRATICLSRAVTKDYLQGSQIPAGNLSYGALVKATIVCLRGGKAQTKHNLGAASLFSFIHPQSFQTNLPMSGMR
jgi:hypothetical protein